jgi:dihydroneopterin aldolase
LTIPLRAERQDRNVEPQNSLRGEAPRALAASDLRLGVFGIRFIGHHGVHPDERERGNRFEIDVELECATADVVETDELADAIDYREVTDLVREINGRQPFNLIESFAGAIASALLARFPKISTAVVRVSKLAPPGVSDVDRTMAEVTRSRG